MAQARRPTEVEPLSRILSATPGAAGEFLGQIYDRASDHYFVPAFPGPDPYEALRASGIDGSGVTAAIIDTGFVLRHPWIADALLESVDFTGEGPEDMSGHGTMCALLFLLSAPRARLINVKALDATGQGTYRSLIDAVEWCVANGVRVVNMSCGVFQSSCQGDCELCSAVRLANVAGTIVMPAVGNHSGETACPAKLALFHPQDGFAIGAFNMEEQAIADYSGKVGPQGLLGPIYQYVRYELQPHVPEADAR